MGEKEQAMLNFMGTWLAFPDPVVAKSTYDAEWVSLFDDVGSDWYNTWADIWEVTFGEVEFFPGVFLEAAIWTIDGWLSFNVWKLDVGYTCPSPCRYTSGIFTLPP